MQLVVHFAIEDRRNKTGVIVHKLHLWGVFNKRRSFSIKLCKTIYRIEMRKVSTLRKPISELWQSNYGMFSISSR